MNKQKLEYYLQRAEDEGANDTELDEILVEHAQQFIFQDVMESVTDEQQEALVQAYQKGFILAYGKEYLKSIIKGNK